MRYVDLLERGKKTWGKKWQPEGGKSTDHHNNGGKKKSLALNERKHEGRSPQDFLGGSFLSTLWTLQLTISAGRHGILQGGPAKGGRAPRHVAGGGNK